MKDTIVETVYAWRIWRFCEEDARRFTSPSIRIGGDLTSICSRAAAGIGAGRNEYTIGTLYVRTCGNINDGNKLREPKAALLGSIVLYNIMYCVTTGR